VHIPDGFLTPPVWGAAAGVSAGYLAMAVRRLRRRLEEQRLPLAGVLAAFIFAAQMLNFPVAPGASGHFLGSTLATLLFGPWQAGLIMSVILIIQAFVFMDGGVTTLGANILNMAIIAPWVSWALLRAVRGRPGIFVASWAAVVAGALACGLELSLSGLVSWRLALPAIVGWHALIGVGEGLITLAVAAYLVRAQVDLGEGGTGTW
jgi:cobalt/nickel transport system permease protein